MTVVRERALPARALLLEIAVQAACDAGALDLGDVEARRAELASEWPEGVDTEQLLDTRSGLSARLEQAVAHARQHRREAAEMAERTIGARAEAVAMRDRARARTTRAAHLADAHEALAILALLDDEVFEIPEAQA